jgi:leucyl aminopeptidase (aminopeptidase T)
MAITSLTEDATLVVDVCMSVEEGDNVTIICDDDHADQAKAVADICVERGAFPVIMNNETQVRRGRADVRFPMAPPANLHRAMVGSDEVIIITDLEWANRFAHVNAVRETCEANGKIASVEPGMGEWGLTLDDIETATKRAKDAMAALEGKKQVRVTTKLGTDFSVSIEGRPSLELSPKKRRGQMMGPLPLWAEVAFAAVEDFTHGSAVVDGVMLGISDKAPFGTPSEKGRAGTVHLALGDNHNAYPGGQNHSVLHLDGVFLDATMWIVDDGTYILRDGEWVL